ncbi:MAG: hypothetical protein IH595_13265 [Bacteroidales bacterium]|nr:hypothetical protein [Bacteroidales bacterium]
MKTDFYTKAVLTVIAICLVIIVFKQVDIVPRAYANAPQTQTQLDPTVKYGLVPVNSDGTINVRIKSSCQMDVNITELDGSAVRSWLGLPVSIVK